MIKERDYKKVVFLILAAVLVSLAFAVRIVNSISIALLAIMIFFHPQRALLIRKAFSKPYFICCILLLLIKFSGIFYTNNISETLRQLSNKGLILVAIPFFFCSSPFLSTTVIRRLLVYFTASLFIVSLYCILVAFANYYHQNDSSVFFYHQLVRPFKHHAVLFSFYLFFCIIYWMQNDIHSTKNTKRKPLIISIIVYFSGFIVLLSSKLVIILFGLYLFYFIISSLTASKFKYGLFLVGLFMTVSISIFTNNPIKTRFRDAISGSTNLFMQEKFSPDIYFNGVQLRLLIWRFTAEILSEKKAWLTGVSMGDAQYELNRKYLEANVYSGNGITDKKGYLVFNCHNVFLQTTLESGVLGLAFLLSIIVIFLWQAVKARNQVAMIFFLSITAFCFTESVLSSQYTILLFMFLPLLVLNIKTGE